MTGHLLFNPQTARNVRVDVRWATTNPAEILQTREAHTSPVMSALGVRRDKGGAFQWVQVPPGKRSSRKQPEQSWR